MCFWFLAQEKWETKPGQLNGKCAENGANAISQFRPFASTFCEFWRKLEFSYDFLGADQQCETHTHTHTHHLSATNRRTLSNTALLTFCKWAESQLWAMHQVRQAEQAEIHVNRDLSDCVSWSECVALSEHINLVLISKPHTNLLSQFYQENCKMLTLDEEAKDQCEDVCIQDARRIERKRERNKKCLPIA